MIVAPSFVMMTSPLEVSISLSIPFGPKLVFIISAMALAARILEVLTSSAFSDFF